MTLAELPPSEEGGDPSGYRLQGFYAAGYVVTAAPHQLKWCAEGALPCSAHHVPRRLIRVRGGAGPHGFPSPWHPNGWPDERGR